MTTVTKALEAVRVGSPISFGNLTMFPLLCGESGAPSYITLDEALATRLARVTEVSQTGSVPELFFENGGDVSVLLLDGEELVGAKQNRILNLTILVGANTKVVIPVSCVERGRWGYESREFRSGKKQLFARARAAKVSQVSRSLRQTGSRRSEQMSVWDSIDDQALRLNARSDTGAMADNYDSVNDRLEQFHQAFRPIEHQTGAVFALDGRVFGAELLGAATTFHKLMDKLIASYAIDAIGTQDVAAKAPTVEDVTAFLERIKSAPIESFPAIGAGEDLRLHGPGVAGAALVVDEQVVHLSAFADA